MTTHDDEPAVAPDTRSAWARMLGRLGLRRCRSRLHWEPFALVGNPRCSLGRGHAGAHAAMADGITFSWTGAASDYRPRHDV